MQNSPSARFGAVRVPRRPFIRASAVVKKLTSPRTLMETYVPLIVILPPFGRFIKRFRRGIGDSC